MTVLNGMNNPRTEEEARTESDKVHVLLKNIEQVIEGQPPDVIYGALAWLLADLGINRFEQGRDRFLVTCFKSIDSAMDYHENMDSLLDVFKAIRKANTAVKAATEPGKGGEPGGGDGGAPGQPGQTGGPIFDESTLAEFFKSVGKPAAQPGEDVSEPKTE